MDNVQSWIEKVAASWWREHRGEEETERVFDLSMALFE
jgi:hypothetical protein